MKRACVWLCMNSMSIKTLSGSTSPKRIAFWCMPFRKKPFLRRSLRKLTGHKYPFLNWLMCYNSAGSTIKYSSWILKSTKDKIWLISAILKTNRLWYSKNLTKTLSQSHPCATTTANSSYTEELMAKSTWLTYPVFSLIGPTPCKK